MRPSNASDPNTSHSNTSDSKAESSQSKRPPLLTALRQFVWSAENCTKNCGKPKVANSHLKSNLDGTVSSSKKQKLGKLSGKTFLSIKAFRKIV